jgi:AhpD family alkylhydroperoxidase
VRSPGIDSCIVGTKEMQELIALQGFMDSSGLDEVLIELVRLRVSRVSGCDQGARRHLRKARLLGESIERLDALDGWRLAPLFSAKERAALEWSDAVICASRAGVSDNVQADVREWFTEIELIKLTVLIAVTLAWNRVDVCLGS